MPSNRLIHEKSPYLIQHAHNPVDWYPWGNEAFIHARHENKPVFLSVGYSTCHWCHVMEKESFEDEETARHLNETFVCIKVDREERPDIDAVYMAACQMLTGSGGWPLTIFMTSDKNPFFGSTYIPKYSRFGRAGLIDLCQRVKMLWDEQKEKIIETAISIAGSLEQNFIFSPADEPDISVLNQAYTQIEQSFDSRFGGFGPAPKFPTPHRLLFLLNDYHRTGNSPPSASLPPPLFFKERGLGGEFGRNSNPLDMVKKTLTAMRLGGICDHIGFGFHRYSTDSRWLLPHFEKMLYDQALLAMAYLETYRVTKESLFAKTAEDIFTYVLRDMKSEQGAFFTAEDADSEGEEGKFYVWTVEEFRKILGKDESTQWEAVFNLTENGNFIEEASGHETGANILHLDRTFSQWAETLGVSENEFNERSEKTIHNLFAARSKRIRPFKDDKILTDWNGLMIGALAAGSRILEKPEYIQAADQAARFILTTMKDAHGRLVHRFRDGEAGIAAFADDYAFLILGLLELHKATLDSVFLKQAIALQKQMLDNYWDSENGGFFLTSSENHELPVRPKDLYDGAMPSANSVSLVNLIHLSQLTGESEWKKKADTLARAFFGTVKVSPSGYTYFLLGISQLCERH